MQRRRERRYEVWESVVATVPEPGEPRHCAATVVDISQSGYRILLARELAVDTEVLITLNSVAIVGRVRHCEPSGADTFAAGVEITGVEGGVAEPNNAGEALAQTT
jgi:PilZ domain